VIDGWWPNALVLKPCGSALLVSDKKHPEAGIRMVWGQSSVRTVLSVQTRLPTGMYPRRSGTSTCCLGGGAPNDRVCSMTRVSSFLAF